MRITKHNCVLSLLLLTVLVLGGCEGELGSGNGSNGQHQADTTLTIVAGSESKEIEPIIQDWARNNRVHVKMIYSGSVDMMLELQKESFPYDAALPANSMWLRLGDMKLHRIKEEASIMRSPVVFGIKKSKAEELGWTQREVVVADILSAVERGRLRFAMTSATQSNSGASAYIGLLYALVGKPDVLTLEHLNEPGLKKDIRTIFGGLDRSSGSSGWLKDMFLARHASLDGMVNYESMIINANKELIARGEEPLYAIYPSDGLAIADSTLGFVQKEDNKEKLPVFIKLRDYLLSEDVQRRILGTGFRTGIIGINPEQADPSIYNPAWGIDVGKNISPINWPEAEVIYEALKLFQTSFRKPSYTAYLLDISGSMDGEGIYQLKLAMDLLLNQERASQYFIQASENDVTLVIAFNHDIAHAWKITGNNPEEMTTLLAEINRLEATGGTDIYRPVNYAITQFSQLGERMNDYLPSIILLTDGRSNRGSLHEVQQFWRGVNAPFDFPPVFGVTFGNADESQLRELAKFSVARVFDGRKDGLEAAFKKARGYN